MSYMYFNDPDTWRSAKKEEKPEPTSWDGTVGNGRYQVPAAEADIPAPMFQAGDGNAAISVDSRALTWFADEVDKLPALLDEARNGLEATKPAPGRFRAGQQLKEKLESEHGSVLTFVEALRRMSPALTELAAAMRQLSKDYTTSEMLSSEAGLKAVGTALDDFDKTTTGTGGA